MVAMLADPICVSLCIRWGCVLTQSIQLQRKEHSADAKCLQLPRGCVLPLADCPYWHERSSIGSQQVLLGSADVCCHARHAFLHRLFQRPSHT